MSNQLTYGGCEREAEQAWMTHSIALHHCKHIHLLLEFRRPRDFVGLVHDGPAVPRDGERSEHRVVGNGRPAGVARHRDRSKDWGAANVREAPRPPRSGLSPTKSHPRSQTYPARLHSFRSCRRVRSLRCSRSLLASSRWLCPSPLRHPGPDPDRCPRRSSGRCGSRSWAFRWRLYPGR